MFSYRLLEERIPPAHPLRKLRALQGCSAAWPVTLNPERDCMVRLAANGTNRPQKLA
ncbi:hypothetical protein [Janthinobacterium fluminis]|uniref:hypothetical protein n=1 Tax=Janthinobacterium fluminis TaxID=2987524 RepID=UPI00235977CD|nr:hypothetical protein [Janthinobacterium fluminis]